MVLGGWSPRGAGRGWGRPLGWGRAPSPPPLSSVLALTGFLTLQEPVLIARKLFVTELGIQICVNSG